MAICINCDTEQKTVFDYRCDRKDKCCRLYVIFENGKIPTPTGYCLECLLVMLKNEFEILI